MGRFNPGGLPFALPDPLSMPDHPDLRHDAELIDGFSRIDGSGMSHPASHVTSKPDLEVGLFLEQFAYPRRWSSSGAKPCCPSLAVIGRQDLLSKTCCPSLAVIRRQDLLSSAPSLFTIAPALLSPFPQFIFPSRRRRCLEQTMNIFDMVAEAVIARGDLAHLALFVWASGASALLAMTLRDLFAANRRFDEFVRELTLFNRRQSGDFPGDFQ
jgi:hypothetical protein